MVSPAKEIVFFSHVEAELIVYDFEICLELSTSWTSIIYVPVFTDLTQKDNVIISALAVPFLSNCKFWPSNLCWI